MKISIKGILMKKLFILFMLCLFSFSACTSSTEYGECIGAFDDGDPSLVYSTSAFNIFLGVVFIETIIVPVIVLASETKCPVAFKKKLMNSSN